MPNIAVLCPEGLWRYLDSNQEVTPVFASQSRAVGRSRTYCAFRPRGYSPLPLRRGVVGIAPDQGLEPRRTG